MDALAVIFPLQFRIIAVVAIFSFLGYRDWRKNPTNPTRLKEYLFLLSLAGIGTFYGVVHDLITVCIFLEYFIYGKGIFLELFGFYLRTSWLAVKATYWVGLIVAVVFLVANNPSKTRKQLSYTKLYRHLAFPLITSIFFVILVGTLFYFDVFGMGAEDISEMKSPGRFMLVWGIHHGSYIGGLVGVVIGGLAIFRQRGEKIPIYSVG